MSMMDRLLRRGAEIPVPTTGTTFSLARILNQGTYDTDPIKNDADALKSYSGWVYACVSTISQDVRSSSWNVWEKAGASRDDWKPLDEPRLPSVLLRPNATETWGDLIELTQVHLDLAGRAFWHLITNGPGGNVIGIQSINPDWISKAVYNDARTQLIGWELAASGTRREVLPAEDVVLFRYPDPIDPTGGISPIRAVAMSADMDTYSRAYAASHLRNHAQPTGILTTENELTRDQATTLADAWRETHAGTDRIQVLGKGAQFQTLSAHIKDLEFLNLARVSRDQILAAYHVPASKLGLVEDASRANGEESDRVYSSLCLGPRLRRYHEPITLRVLPRLGLDPSRFCFEFDPVEVADKTFERDAAQAAFQAGAITLDEYRERIGFPPAENGSGEVYFVPFGANVVTSPDEAPGNSMPAPPAPPVADEDRSVRVVVETETREAPAVEVEADDRELEDPSDERINLTALRFLSKQGEAERRMKGRLRSIFSRMQSAVVQAVKEGKRALPEHRASLQDLGTVMDEFNGEIHELLTEEARRNFAEGFDDFSDEIAAAVSPNLLIDFELIDDDVIEWARSDSEYKITTISESLKNAVRDELQASLEEGESIRDLARRLNERFNKLKSTQAETIARTETAGAYNHGKYTNAEAFDKTHASLRVTKTWVPTQDERTREAHRAHMIQNVQGDPKRTVLREEAFVVDGERLMRPLDQNGSPGNVINCRCVLTFDVQGEL